MLGAGQVNQALAGGGGSCGVAFFLVTRGIVDVFRE
jgi:hypothetical protein